MALKLTGALPQLSHLYLNDNKIGDKGLEAFSGALVNRALSKLEILYLSRNQIGDPGLTAFASACASGVMLSLKAFAMEHHPKLKAARWQFGIRCLHS